MQVGNPATRSALFWIIGAFFFVLAGTLLPTVGVALGGPLMSLIMGAAAAWWVRSARNGSVEEAAGSGAVAGLGAAAAAVAAFIVFGWLLGSDPALQEPLRTTDLSEVHIPADWLAPLVASASGFVGLAAGLVNLMLAVIGAALVGLATPQRLHQPGREYRGAGQ